MCGAVDQMIAEGMERGMERGMELSYIGGFMPFPEENGTEKCTMEQPSG